MALCHTGMTRISFVAQQLTTNLSVTDVWFRTSTTDAGCITLVDANVMQHRSLFQELHVNRQFLMFTNNLQATVSYLSTVFQE